MIGLGFFALKFREKATVFVLKISHKFKKILNKTSDPDSIREGLINLFSAWDSLKNNAWRKPFLGAFLNVLFDMLTLYFLFIAAGHRVSVGVLLTGYGLPLLLGKMAFMIPGGVGVIESSMTGLYTGLGVPQAVTVVVVLGYRIISFWIPLLLGFPLIPFLERGTKNG